MDLRNFVQDKKIQVETYCDQPYLVRTDDGSWLCTLTTGPRNEGGPGQHLYSHADL